MQLKRAGSQPSTRGPAKWVLPAGIGRLGAGSLDVLHDPIMFAPSSVLNWARINNARQTSR